MDIRSALFVPGDRPERFDKALASGAHLVCIDLEDAVAPQRKQAAREATRAFLHGHPSASLAVRVNRLGSQYGLSDLLALVETEPPIQVVLLPKVESAAQVEIVADLLGSHTKIVPLIESARGVAEAAQIANARQCAAVMFGGHDFASEVGAAMDWEPMLVARSLIVQACARAGVLAIDAPFIAMRDQDALEVEARRARALGFGAKAAIHPAQVDTIHRVFRPDEHEIQEARDAIAAFRAAKESAIQFRGKLVDNPMIRRYERTLTRAGIEV